MPADAPAAARECKICPLVGKRCGRRVGFGGALFAFLFFFFLAPLSFFFSLPLRTTHRARRVAVSLGITGWRGVRRGVEGKR